MNSSPSSATPRGFNPQQLPEQIGNLIGETSGLVGQLVGAGNNLIRWLVVAIMFQFAFAGFLLGGCARAIGVGSLLYAFAMTLRGWKRWVAGVSFAAFLLIITSNWSGLQATFPFMGVVEGWLMRGKPADLTILPMSTLVLGLVATFSLPLVFVPFGLLIKEGRTALQIASTVVGYALTGTVVLSMILALAKYEPFGNVDWEFMPFVTVGALALAFFHFGQQSRNVRLARWFVVVVITAAFTAFLIGGREGVERWHAKAARLLAASPVGVVLSPPATALVTSFSPTVTITNVGSWTYDPGTINIPLRGKLKFDVAKGSWTKALRLPLGDWTSFTLMMPDTNYQWWWMSGEVHENPPSGNLSDVFEHGKPPSNTFRLCSRDASGIGEIWINP